jgi:uncharacterized membrane protein
MAGRWLKWVMVASLAVNVFLLGAIITAYLRRGQDHPATGAQRPTFRAAALSLTAPHHAALLDLLTNEGRKIQADNQRARRLREEAWTSLSTPSFDPQSVKTELANARAINLQSRGLIEGAVVDFAAGLPPAERVAFGDALRRTMTHPRSAAQDARESHTTSEQPP